MFYIIIDQGPNLRSHCPNSSVSLQPTSLSQFKTTQLERFAT